MSIPNTTKFSFNVSVANSRRVMDLMKKFYAERSNETFTLELPGVFSLPNILSLESVHLEMPEISRFEYETQEPATVTLTVRQVPVSI